MNVLSPRPMDRASFLAWVEGRDGRYELSKGRVVMMTGGSRGHALVVRGLSRALEGRLDAGRWTVLTSDFAAPSVKIRSVIPTSSSTLRLANSEI